MNEGPPKMDSPMIPPPAPTTPVGATDPLVAVREVAERLRARMRYDIMGRDDVIELVLVSLLVD